MTPQPQPTEYIITMARIIKARNMLMVDGYKNADVLDRMVNLLRSRPNTPAAPSTEEEMREAYQNGYTDGQAKAAIENERCIEGHRKAERELSKKMYSLMMCVKKENTDEFMEYYESRMHEFEESLRGGGAPRLTAASAPATTVENMGSKNAHISRKSRR